MADDPLHHLPAKQRQQIQALVEAAAAALGATLAEVALVGAAAHPDRPDRARHPELLLLVDGLEVAQMRELAEAMAPFVRKGLRFRTVGQDELESGLDVYALEVAQWQAVHIHVHGARRLAELAKPKPADLRHELERSLRGISRRVRNRVIQGLAAQVRSLDTILADAFDHLLIAAHHSLALAGEQPPATEAALLERFASWLELEPKPLVALLGRLRGGERGDDPLAEFSGFDDLLARACTKIDQLETA